MLDLFQLHRHHSDDLPFLLETLTGANAINRYSFLLAVSSDSESTISLDDQTNAAAMAFFDQLEQAYQNVRVRVNDGGGDDSGPGSGPETSHLPFIGGWFLLLGYELAAGIEPKLDLHASPLLQPVAYAKRCDAAIIVDHELQQTYLVAESNSRLIWLQRLIEQQFEKHTSKVGICNWDINVEPGEVFCESVDKVKSYIRAGDVFQVNLSRGWQAKCLDRHEQCPLYGDRDKPLAVYDALRRMNPAPFAGLAKLPTGYLLSASPERLVLVDQQHINTRPIAGTRPRGESSSHDEQLLNELLSNPKERAEHVMLIDLERNDLGRVCVPGSVEVNEFMGQESYASVHHIVSNVRGYLRDDVSPIDALKAVFPGGTITGCPKVRCMEIIAELEQQGRGFYTGSMGYLSRDGRLDTSILIRTGWWQDDTLHWRCGGGIVADSEAQAELHETEAKAAGMLKALQLPKRAAA